MHELGLMVNILEIAEAAAQREGANAIRVIGLRVGALSGVEPDALEFAFESARHGTLAEAARLEIEVQPFIARCETCQLEYEVADRHGVALCPNCDRPSATVLQGSDLEVRYLEVV